MTAFELGDVVLVRFPFTDQSATKQRPAVVVSSDAYHRSRPVVGEAAIRGWKEAGLIKPSVFKPLLATVEQSLPRPKLGRLEPEDRRTSQDLLPIILGG